MNMDKRAASPALEVQIKQLIELGYPKLMGLSTTLFHNALVGLTRYLAPQDLEPVDSKAGKLPFVLVVNAPRMPVRTMLPLIKRRGKEAVERLYPIEPEQFKPIKNLEIPHGHAYLLLDIDRGTETLNVTPDVAFVTLQEQQRSPLSVEEGVAIVTQFPEFLQPNHCFSMLGSRCGDKRVPALWLSNGHPKLGWCWAGNPHTWLGSASCGRRSPAVELPMQLEAA